MGYTWTTSGGRGEAKDPLLSSLKRSVESTRKAGNDPFVLSATYEMIPSSDLKSVASVIGRPWISPGEGFVRLSVSG